MRAHYDFDKMKHRKNPYAKMLKRCVTIQLDYETIGYFKSMAGAIGVGLQPLISLYLRDCVLNRRKLKSSWTK